MKVRHLADFNKLSTMLSTGVDNFNVIKLIHSSTLIISKQRNVFKKLSTKKE